MRASFERRAPAGLVPYLRRFRRRVFLLRALRACGATAGAAALLFAAALLADRYFLLGNAARAAISAAVLSLAGAAALLGLARFLRPLRPLDLARGLEAECPELEEGLLTAVSLAGAAERDAGASPVLLRALEEGVASKLSRRDVGRLLGLEARRARAAAGAGAAAVALLLGAAFTWPRSFEELARRFFHPGLDLPRPSTVLLEVVPGNATVARGTEVEVKAALLRGEAAAELTLSHRREGGEWTETRGVVTAGAAYTRRFGVLREGLVYRVRAGDFESPLYRIDVREGPRAESFRITYRYPAYTGLAPETIAAARGDLRALAGTRADVQATATEAVVGAHLKLSAPPPAGGAPAPLERHIPVEGRTVAAMDIPIARDSDYEIVLEGADGVATTLRYRIAALPDRPPEVELVEPRGSEIAVEPRSAIDFHYRAVDDVALAALDLVLEPPGGAPLVTSLDPAAGSRRLDLAGLSLRAGDVVPFFLRARDGLGQEGRTAPQALRVAFLPPPPEGPGWPGPLAEAVSGLRAALADWRRLLPFTGGGAAASLAADRARLEMLRGAVERSVGTRLFLGRLGTSLTEAARGIAVPSPNRAALAAAARRLRRAARLELRAFEAEASRAAGAMDAALASGPAAAGAVSAADLERAWRAAGGAMEEAAGGLRAILRAERVEEALEGCLTLLQDERELLASAAGSDAGASAESGDAGLLARRQTALVREATTVGAGLASSAAIGAGVAAAGAAAEPAPAEDTETAAAASALLEAVVPPLEAARARLAARERPPPAAPAAPGPEARGAPRDAREALERAAAALQAETEKLGALHDRLEKLAGAARSRLELEDAVAPALVELGRSLGTDRARGRARVEEILVDLQEETDDFEDAVGFENESVFDLAASSDLLQELARALEAASAADGRFEVALVDGLEKAWRATTPLRLLERAASELDRIAEAQEDIAGKLRAAAGWNFRSRRALYRGAREIRRTLAAVAGALARAVEGPRGAAVRGELAAAAAAMEAALGKLERGEAGAAEEAARVAAQVDRARSRLEDLALAVAGEAAAARAWLRSQLGTLPERIVRAAKEERAGAAQARDAAAAAPDGAGLAAGGLRAAQEERRGRVLRLAARARGEAELLLSAGAPAAAARAHDRAAAGLEALALGGMLAAGRALAAAEEGAGAARSGHLLEASALELGAAADLEAVASALDALVAEAFLAHVAEDLAGAGDDGRGEAGRTGEQPPPLELVEKEARLLLERTLRSSETLAARLAAGSARDLLLGLLADAAARFQEALGAVARRDAAAAAGELAAGRRKLEEAVALARKIRGEVKSQGEDDAARLANLAGEKREDDSAPEAAASRELEEAYAELGKLLALGAVEKEVDALFRELLGAREGDASLRARAEDAEEDLLQRLDNDLLSVNDLVDLVAALLLIEKRSAELVAEERRLSGEALQAPSPPAGTAPAAPLDPALRRRQEEAVARARALVGDFAAAGYKLSAAVPQVLRAYVEARAAGDAFLLAAEEAAKDPAAAAAPGEVEAPPEKAAAGAEARAARFLAAAEKADAFRARVGEARGAALAAITAVEMGESGSPSTLGGTDKAHRAFREAMQLLKAGKLGEAYAAQQSGARSLASAAARLRGELRSRQPGEAGATDSLAPFGAAEAAAGAGAWKVVARGAIAPGAEEIGRTAAADDVPFPPQFRDLVQLYRRALRALEGGR